MSTNGHSVACLELLRPSDESVDASQFVQAREVLKKELCIQLNSY